MTEDPTTPANTSTDGGATPEIDVNRLVRERYEKAARLTEEGVMLYPHRFAPRPGGIAQVRAESEALLASGEEVTLAGRILIVRSFGKAGFLVVRDGSGEPGADGRHSGQIQFYVKTGVTDESGYELYRRGLDAGDIVGATGRLFVSKTGELTLEARELTLLTKSLRPLPEKWHGLKDVDLRYRQRYVDLIVNPEVAHTFRMRSRVISLLRRRLDALGYMEVETPMMQAIYGGASARPFVTHHNALDIDLYLRIAPELFLKRLVVGGFERVYEINRNFRNEGLSTRHNPEFTMLELYTAWWDYHPTMDLCEALIREAALELHGTGRLTYQGREVDFESPFRRVRILDAVAEALGMSADHGLRWGVSTQEDQRLMQLFEERVEPTLQQPTFMIDFPKSLCPLAKSKADDPATAERFELFVAGMELANAYSELNDPREQLQKFQDQVAQRRAGDEEAMNQVDTDYFARWNTACRRRAGWASASTGW